MKKTLLLLTFGLAILASSFANTLLLAAPATYTPKIKNIRIRQTTDTNAGSYKIVVIVKHDDNDEVANVEIDVTPANPTSPTPNQAQLLLTYEAENSDYNKKSYVNSSLGFASAALGEDYSVTVTMKDIFGNVIGDVETQTVKVTLDKTDPLQAPAVSGIRIADNGSGYEAMAFVTDPANEVAAVRFEITPVTSGAPAPNRAVITLSYDTTLPDLTKRFANYGGLLFPSSAVGYQYAVGVTLLDGNSLQVGQTVILSTIVVN